MADAEPSKPAPQSPASEAPQSPPTLAEERKAYERWYHHVHFQHQGMKRDLISLGHWSSLFFMALIGITPWVPEFLYPYHDWVGFIYLAIQFAEVNAEDHLHNKEVLWDHLLSAFPALLGLVWLAVFLTTGKFIAEHGWESLKWYTACAWFDFIAGVVMNNTILNAPYQREEQRKD